MKTKVFFFVIALISTVVIFSSCESKSGKRVREIKNNTTITDVARVSLQYYDSLRMQASQAEYLNEEVERMQKLIYRLEKNPLFYLLVLDAELSATENGEEVYGGFTDYFVPTILAALKAGIPRVEIQKRINKLVKLANRGLFISSYEEELYKDGGAEAIVEYIIANALDQ